MIGPPRQQMGGMATVVDQLAAMSFCGRYRITSFPSTHATDDREGLFGRTLRHIRHVAVLRRTLRATGAGIVHIHTCSGFSFYRSTLDMLAAQWLGRRVVLHVHGAMFDEFHAREPRWRRRVIAWSLTRADRVIALSPNWRAKLLAIAPRASIVTIENAVAAPEPRDGPWAAADACRFLLLARMDSWKGIDDLLAASGRLRLDGVRFDLTLAGPPGTAGDAEAIAAKIAACELGDHVRYVGALEGERKALALRRSDVYVQPSHHEGMPLALLEALAFGLPVVATSVGAVPEVVEHERHGLLVSPRSPRQFAEAMRRLAEDVALRRHLATNARTLAETRFNLARLEDDLTQLYDDLKVPRHDAHHPPTRAKERLSVGTAGA